MRSRQCKVFTPWPWRFFSMLLALLVVVACPGDNGQDDQVNETVPPSAVEGLCPALFAEDAVADPPLVKFSTCTAVGGNITIGDKVKDENPNACGPNVFVDKNRTIAGKITINANATLDFPNQNLNLTTQAILVDGRLSAGTKQCPITKKITLTFTGARTCPALKNCTSDTDDTTFSKGILVRTGGTLRMVGAKGVPTSGATSGVSWTYLNAAAGPRPEGAADTSTPPISATVDRTKTLFVADDVTKDWKQGDWIAVATTSFNPFETEFVQLASAPTPAGSSAPNGAKSRIALAQFLQYYHFGSLPPTPSQMCTVKGKLQPVACGTVKGCTSTCTSAPSRLNFADPAERNYGVDERTEVGLISRNIKLTAATPQNKTDPSLHWGGEIKIVAGASEVTIQGVELEKFGKDQLGSYPIHFHMDGDVADNPLVDSNSIHHSYNKCITVHSTQNLTISNNVCARIVGHIFYEETGDEKDISFINNLGLGAMSNNFDIDPNGTIKTAKGETKKLTDLYWAGDNLAKSSGYNYDGLNIPNSDFQQNSTRGSCKCVAKNQEDLVFLEYPYIGYHTGACDPTKIVPPPANDHRADNCDATKGERYTEPASGFWIINPGTVLVGNSIGGCQGVGRAYWYVPPAAPGFPGPINDLTFKPLGTFQNNRAHGCYAGLYGEGENDILSQHLNPRVGGAAAGKNLIGTFDGFTATRMRDRGLWIREVWFVVKNGRFATSRDSVSLVTSGGLDGNAPGVWSLLMDSVVVGVSRNNVDRWGPCPGGSTNYGCIDGFVTNVGGNKLANDVNARGYPSPDWNTFGYLIYDGPARLVHNRFVNFKRDPSALLTTADAKFMKSFNYAKGNPKPTRYEGDAALGWFNSNQSAYPTATVGSEFIFENVDLRHQIYTQGVFISAPFNDGDKNTAILDEDGTLSGFQVVGSDGKPLPTGSRQFPISLNNLEFNHSSNAVDECFSEGQQDTDAEGRPTSLMSPGNMATLEFGTTNPTCNDPDKIPPVICFQRQNITFTKDSLDYGKHQSMTLITGRNDNGLYEPKVTSGFGYTITADKGLPDVVHLGLTDPVKPDIVAPSTANPDGKNPFFVRVGMCFTSSTGKPPDKTKLTVERGYRSWGGNGVNLPDPDLKKYFVQLHPDHSYSKQYCKDKDSDNQRNLTDPVDTRCPADGVTAAPDGDCPLAASGFPSVFKDTAGSPGNQVKACIYPASSLMPVDNILKLQKDGKKDGPPDPTKYFYDDKNGWLFFHVVQEFPNPIAGSPLGSCSADGSGKSDDPACPDVVQKESFYACPAQGCIDYVVRLNDSTYKAAPSACGEAYPTYAQDPPAKQNLLAYVGGTRDGKTVIACRDPKSLTGFDHSVPFADATCSTRVDQAAICP